MKMASIWYFLEL